ncbi:thioredoxin [Bacillus sp. Bos-x628]|uniref:thioredoxin n=1 Tax=Bacillus maqinnsis TaxID=3229854 RepID=UPI00338F6BCF
MIKIIWAYKEKDPLKVFLESQLNAADLKGYEVKKFSIDRLPELIDLYELKQWCNVIFLNKDGKKIAVFEGPFSSKDIENTLEFIEEIIKISKERGF